MTLSWILPTTSLVPASEYVPVAALVVLLTGFSKAGFGGGVGILATPLLLMVLPGPTALSMMLPILIICDIFTLRRFPREWSPASFRSLAPWFFLGLFFGLGLLLLFTSQGGRGDHWIRLFVGLVVLFQTLGSMFLKRRRHPGGESQGPGFPGPWVDLAVGLACGITTMVAHSAGVLLSLYLLSYRLSPGAFVGTTTRFYITFNLIKIPFFVLATPLAGVDFLTLETLKYVPWLIPFCYIGVACGAWLNRRFSRDRYQATVNFLLAVSGFYLVLSSGWALAGS